MKYPKTLIILVILLACTIYITLFTIKSYSITQHIYEDIRNSEIYWRTSSSGTISPSQASQVTWKHYHL